VHFTRRRMAVLGVSGAALVLLALGLWAGFEYWLKPMEIGRATTVFVYKNWSMVLRGNAEYYQALHSEDAELQAEARRMSAWADWFDNRIRILEATRWFRPEQENRIYRDFRRKNPDLSRWDEAVGRIW